MADSLFDNRYRYDYIYPRGRSGETLRAVDVQDHDRPVVVKRPAPNDAPPIRAGQEVSIVNERKALTRLAGHPALTSLVGTGQFSVGGIAHQYIAIERAEGDVIADVVLSLAARGERLPELEMLVIVDQLIDLLMAAHDKDIVYNDVDAKHLFWNRETHCLKVIDWGNAVFLEGDEATPQGISRQSDIYQVGELLYFIVTGGGRVDMPRDAARVDDDFRLSFGEDTSRLHSRLIQIISSAAHPNLRLRYRTLADLRRDLTEYRLPLERDRAAVIQRVNDRLRKDLSRDELLGLLRTLEPALAMDPGYPETRATEQEIHGRLNDLEVAADLDAARIYLESANWGRAITVLEELRPRARGDMAIQIALLSDWARILLENNVRSAPAAVIDAIGAVFEGDAESAAHILQTQDVESDSRRALQWLLAERISAHIPEILLLRPTLYRLDVALNNLHAEGVVVTEPQTLLSEIGTALNSLADPQTINLVMLRDGYRVVVNQLTSLSSLLEGLAQQHGLTNRRMPLTAVTRALNAAMALVDNMHVIGRQATGSPREALHALDNSRQIAPITPAWDGIAHLLDSLYERINAYQSYIPAADGSDVSDWLMASRQELEPYKERLSDEALGAMVIGLESASRAWSMYAAHIVQGNRSGAIAALERAIDAVTPVSPSLARWMEQLRNVVSHAAYPERHALHGAMGRALADGWEHFDRGRLVDAERLGIQAIESARTEAEHTAARRLRELSQWTREWVERAAVADSARTRALLSQIESLFTPDEMGLRDSFTTQMPSKETYLRAMNKGLVEQFSLRSTAAVRILFMNYILLAAVDAQAENEEDARFWREAALKTLGEAGLRHPAMRTVSEFLDRRRDLRAATQMINEINGSHALPNIEATVRAIENNPQNRLLAPAAFSLRELEAAVREWSGGDFRAAGLRLEGAVKALDELEAQSHVTLTQYRAWLLDLLAGAAELHQSAHRLEEIVNSRPDEPVPSAHNLHQQQVEVTQRLLGDAYSQQLRIWRDAYDAFAAVAGDRSLRRSAKLPRFNEMFAAFAPLERHPAYALYQHWYAVTEAQSEFPAPPTDSPVPTIQDEEYYDVYAPTEGAIIEDDRFAAGDTEPTLVPRRKRRRSRLPLILLFVLLLLGGTAAAAVTLLNCCLPPVDLTPTAQDESAAQTAIALIGVTLAVDGASLAAAQITEEPAVTLPPSPTALQALATVPPRAPITASPTRTPSPTLTPTETNTLTPSPTRTPSNTATPSPTATATPSPTSTLPPGGLQGTQNLFSLVEGASERTWTDSQFSLSTEGPFWRLGEGISTTDDADIRVVPSQAELDARYGNAASGRIVRAEADLSLITFNPPLIIDQAVYFGAGFQVGQDEETFVGLHIQVIQPGIINLALRRGDDLTVISQRSDTASRARIRLERDPAANTVTVFYNNDAIGAPMTLPAGASHVLPVIYVRNGGVIVHVLEWSVTLR